MIQMTAGVQAISDGPPEVQLEQPPDELAGLGDQDPHGDEAS